MDIQISSDESKKEVKGTSVPIKTPSPNIPGMNSGYPSWVNDATKSKDFGHTSSRQTLKMCSHPGTDKIQVGKYYVYLGGMRDITLSSLDKIDYLICMGPVPDERVHEGKFKGQILCWPMKDMGGVPPNYKDFLEWIISELKKNKRIMLTCLGGHGRTGTVAAGLIALLEPGVNDPVKELRSRYCKEAVESNAQDNAVLGLIGKMRVVKTEKKKKKKSSDSDPCNQCSTDLKAKCFSMKDKLPKECPLTKLDSDSENVDQKICVSQCPVPMWRICPYGDGHITGKIPASCIQKTENDGRNKAICSDKDICPDAVYDACTYGRQRTNTVPGECPQGLSKE